MNVAKCGNLRLHFQKNPIAGFFRPLRKGFCIVPNTDRLISLLCHISGLDSEQVHGRFQTPPVTKIDWAKGGEPIPLKITFG
jgi:hypothetical protein